MNTNNDTPEPANHMERLKQQAEQSACGAGCSCHSPGASARTGRLICAVILIVAGVLVVKAVTKTKDAPVATAATAFALPAAQAQQAQNTAAVEPAENPAPSAPAADPASVAVATPGTEAPAAPPTAAPAAVGVTLASLNELNTIATASDAVFVYLPGKTPTSAAAPTATLDAAARTLEKYGIKVGLCTLRAGSPDYDLLGAQAPTPGVMAMVKGRGMSTISGEISETKLVQCYVAAASAGGCGAGGCGPPPCP